MKIKNAPYITGTQINYYFICKRKLWLFSRNISMEHTSGLVEIGSIIHENSYARKRKEIELDGIKIDFFEKNKGIINEIKKSKAVEEAHIWQLKYYLYHFDKLGIKVKGQLDYPLIRRRKLVILTNQDIKEIEEILRDIDNIIAYKTSPEKIESKICKKCSYYELCYV